MSDHDPIILDLLKHPAWGHLHKRAEERMDSSFRRLAKQMMSSKDTVPATEVQFHRGFFAGMKFLLDQPTLEGRKLERALKDQQGSDE